MPQSVNTLPGSPPGKPDNLYPLPLTPTSGGLGSLPAPLSATPLPPTPSPTLSGSQDKVTLTPSGGATSVTPTSPTAATDPAEKLNPKEDVIQVASAASGVWFAFVMDRLINRWMANGDPNGPMLAAARRLDELPVLRQFNAFMEARNDRLGDRSNFMKMMSGHLAPDGQAGGISPVKNFRDVLVDREWQAFNRSLDKLMDKARRKIGRNPSDEKFFKDTLAQWRQSMGNTLEQTRQLVNSGKAAASMEHLSKELPDSNMAMRIVQRDQQLATMALDHIQMQQAGVIRSTLKNGAAEVASMMSPLGIEDAASPKEVLKALQKRLSPDGQSLFQELVERHGDYSERTLLRNLTARLDNRAKLLKPFTKQAQAFQMRLKGMEALVLHPYRNVYLIKHYLHHQYNELAGVLDKANMPEAKKVKILQQLGTKYVAGAPTSELQKLVNGVEELSGQHGLKQAVLEVMEQQARLKPLGPIGRTLVSGTAMFSRIIKGETAISQSIQSATAILDKETTLKRVIPRGSRLGLWLTGLGIFGLPFAEAMREDGPMQEKIRVFIRSFAGFSLGSLVGWELGKRLFHGSQILIRLFPLAMTKKLPGMTLGSLVGELGATLLVGSVVQNHVEKACDLLFGKPQSIIKKEAEQKKAKEEAKAAQAAKLAQARQSVGGVAAPGVALSGTIPPSPTPLTPSPVVVAPTGLRPTTAPPLTPTGTLSTGAGLSPQASPTLKRQQGNEPPPPPGAQQPPPPPQAEGQNAQASAASPQPPPGVPPTDPGVQAIEQMQPFTQPVNPQNPTPSPEPTQPQELQGQNAQAPSPPDPPPSEAKTPQDPANPTGIHPVPEGAPLSAVSPQEILNGHVPEVGVEEVEKVAKANMVDVLRPE